MGDARRAGSKPSRRSRVPAGIGWVALLWATAVSPIDAAAETAFRLGGGVGLSVPIGTFIDDYPLVRREDGCPDGGDISSDPWLETISIANDPGLNFQLVGLYGGLEFGVSVSRHQWGAVDATGLAFCLGDDKVLNNLVIDIQDLEDEGLVSGTRRVDDADSFLSALWTVRLMVGYRFYFLDGPIRPYVPVAMGGTVMVSDELAEQFGVTLQVGAGVEFDLTQSVALTLDGRYTADIMQNVALESRSTNELLAQATAGGDSLLESVIEVFQSFSLQAGFLVRF